MDGYLDLNQHFGMSWFIYLLFNRPPFPLLADQYYVLKPSNSKISVQKRENCIVKMCIYYYTAVSIECIDLIAPITSLSTRKKKLMSSVLSITK
jgi:hypothetical protein